MSTPAPLVRSATSGLSGKNAGSPTTKRLPRITPVIDDSPPTTAIATTTSESVATKPSGVNCTRRPTRAEPARPASAPERAKANSLIRAGDIPMAAAASSLSRTASSERPSPLRRTRLTTRIAKHEETEAEEVVAPLGLEGHPTDRGPPQQRRDVVLVEEDRPRQDPRGSHRQGQGGDGEEETAHAEGRRSDDHRGERGDADGEHDGGRVRHPVLHEAVGAHAAEAHERELAERELTGPPGEHREGEGDQRHQDHPGVQEVTRRGRDEERQRDRGEQRQTAGDPSVVPDPPDALERGRDGTHARSEGEALAHPQLPVAHGDHQHGDEHDDQQHSVDQARVGGVVVEDDRLEDPEADPGRERDRQ